MGTSTSPLNVVCICLDTFRADIIGPGRKMSFVETPHLDEFARKAIRFDRAAQPPFAGVAPGVIEILGTGVDHGVRRGPNVLLGGCGRCQHQGGPCRQSNPN